MYERIREGVVAFDLVRPTGFVPQMLAHLVGSGLASLLFVLPAFRSRSSRAHSLGPQRPGRTALCGEPDGWLPDRDVADPDARHDCVLDDGNPSLVDAVHVGECVFRGRPRPRLTLFPHGLEIFARLLPFQASLYTPVGIYVGQISVGRDAAVPSASSSGGLSCCRSARSRCGSAPCSTSSSRAGDDMSSVGVAWTLQKAALRSGMQYRVDFVVGTIMAVAYQGSGFAFLSVVLARFHTIAGWTFGQVAFLYALRLLAHALWRYYRSARSSR